MDALDLSVAVLVGSSSGGYVAQQVAVRSPGRVAGLVLIGSPPTLQGRPAFADEIEGLSDPIDPSWVRAFLETFPLFHDVPDWFLRDRVRESARIPARPHLRGRRPLGPLGRARARCRRHRGLRPGHHRLTPTTILLCEGQQGAVGSTWQSSRGSRPCGHVDHGPNGPPAGNGTWTRPARGHASWGGSRQYGWSCPGAGPKVLSRFVVEVGRLVYGCAGTSPACPRERPSRQHQVLRRLHRLPDLVDCSSQRATAPGQPGRGAPRLALTTTPKSPSTPRTPSLRTGDLRCAQEKADGRVCRRIRELRSEK